MGISLFDGARPADARGAGGGLTTGLMIKMARDCCNGTGRSMLGATTGLIKMARDRRLDHRPDGQTAEQV